MKLKAVMRNEDIRAGDYISFGLIPIGVRLDVYRLYGRPRMNQRMKLPVILRSHLFKGTWDFKRDAFLSDMGVKMPRYVALLPFSNAAYNILEDAREKGYEYCALLIERLRKGSLSSAELPALERLAKQNSDLFFLYREERERFDNYEFKLRNNIFSKFLSLQSAQQGVN
jgi:hypothetical protein